MEGLDILSNSHIEDVKKKYIQNTQFQIQKSEHQEVVEQMTKVNLEFTALLHMISSKGSTSSIPSITKKGNLFDFKG